MPHRSPPPSLLQLRLATELAGVVIWQHDLADGRVSCNEPGLALLGPPPSPLGWTQEEFIGLMHPDDQTPMREAGREALRSGQPVDLQVRYRHRDGSWHHAMTRRVAAGRDSSARADSLLGVALDVTERESARLDLRTASERLALTVRGAGIGTWWHDVATHTNHWDDQMWALRGLAPRPEAPGYAEMMAMVHPEDRDRVQAEIRSLLETGREAQYDFRLILPDGRERWLASRSVRVDDAHGQARRRIGVNWDVTDVRQAASERHAKDLLQRESQAKSELMARLSHELRTPLNAILGFSQLLLDEREAELPQRQEHLQRIHSAGLHLLGLIDDVLQLTRPDGGPATMTPQSVALAPLVDEVLAMVGRPAQERGLILRAQVPADLCARAEPRRLRQVLLNLLTNAIKYNRAGGTVEVEAEARPDCQDRLSLRVRDTGIGMAPEQIEQAFQPFQRLQANHPGVDGVGLGLAIVKSLVLHMDGQIEIHSRPATGTEVRLDLPRAVSAQAAPAGPVTAAAPAEPPPCAAAAPGTNANAEAPRRRLLYIEDNPVNTMIVAELAARHAAIDFRSAETGASGLALAREWQPDLLLLDMQLPDAHGLQVLEHLRADPLTRRIPCIALSANALPEDIRKALAHGFADYWTKPLDFEVFRQAMEALLRQR